MKYYFDELRYDKTDKNSIYNYARKLINKTFREVLQLSDLYTTELKEDESELFSDWNRKGGLGDLIEKHYFQYDLDNRQDADFKDARLELKVTPYKINKNKTISAKERLVISMINYHKIINEDFHQSSLWNKIENILMIYYLWKPEINYRLDYSIKFVYLYNPSKEDLLIILADFKTIQNKIIEGRAHELSEADTFYLGAATKSSSSSVLTTQPNSSIYAKPRAFSFKNSYMTYLLRNFIAKSPLKYESITKDKNIKDFEIYLKNIIDKYKNFVDKELFSRFLGHEQINAKNKYQLLIYKMLGANNKHIEEFEKSNLTVKTIRIEKNGKIIESMSFPTFNIKQLISEKWEESNIFNFFSETKFLFVIFEKSGEDYYLKGSKVWNMPIKDIEGDLHSEWKRAQNIFKDGVELIPIERENNNYIVKNNLPKLNNTNILHVRPHAAKSVYKINGVIYGNGMMNRDADALPNGDLMTKQCFWLNNKYIKKIIEEI